MDATPVTLGQEADAWAGMLEGALERSRSDVVVLGELPLGGTAVGTGINAPPAFAPAVISHLAIETGLPLRASANPMIQQGGQGALAEASAGLRGIAVALTKVANDIRLLSSGPSAGLAELLLPELQAGSSIMPGKVNPVLCESVNQVAGAGVRQRHDGHVRRIAGDPRAEHVPPGDGRRPVRVGHAAGQRVPGLRRQVRLGHRGRRGPLPRLRRALVGHRHRAEPDHRLRPGRRDRPPGRRRAALDRRAGHRGGASSTRPRPATCSTPCASPRPG